ncbi:hypothetical protein MRB53_027094 [Persea americana]|uniref:Uncharacterized protein n=1 Tax=Persea americana TaxID=3435 RepID=A0ACC2LK58_PERAE|nr:hypothetical protein MRB53_027094 [Persea americana]
MPLSKTRNQPLQTLTSVFISCSKPHFSWFVVRCFPSTNCSPQPILTTISHFFRMQMLMENRPRSPSPDEGRVASTVRSILTTTGSLPSPATPLRVGRLVKPTPSRSSIR